MFGRPILMVDFSVNGNQLAARVAYSTALTDQFATQAIVHLPDIRLSLILFCFFAGQLSIYCMYDICIPNN